MHTLQIEALRDCLHEPTSGDIVSAIALTNSGASTNVNFNLTIIDARRVGTYFYFPLQMIAVITTRMEYSRYRILRDTNLLRTRISSHTSNGHAGVDWGNELPVQMLIRYVRAAFQDFHLVPCIND